MKAERNAEIVRMWNGDVAARDIGRKLSITKNVIIGVVKRARERGEITRPMVFSNREKGIMAGIVRWGFKRRKKK